MPPAIPPLFDDASTIALIPLAKNSAPLTPALRLIFNSADAQQTEMLAQRWHLQKHAALRRWTLLRLEEVDKVAGDADALVALVCDRYALSHDEVDKQVRHFFSSYVPAVSLDAFNGQWKQFIASAKVRWANLSHQELHQLHGNRDQLIDRVRKRYGLSREVARQQVMDFIADCAATQRK